MEPKHTHKLQADMGAVLGYPTSGLGYETLQKILVALGETVDMDDDTEDKCRLDRARVLVKTPWSPTIRHTVDIDIGAECFQVFVVEECGGGDNQHRRGGGSSSGSSEEIDFDDSHLGNFTPRSTTSLGMVGDMQDPTAPKKAAEPRGISDSRTTAIVDLGGSLLSGGQWERNHPLGNATKPWILRKPPQVTSDDQSRQLRHKATVTYLPNNTLKQGGCQCVGTANREDKGNLGHEKGSGVREIQMAKTKASGDVEATCEVAVTQTLCLGSENSEFKNCNVQETYEAERKNYSSKEGDNTHVEESGPEIGPNINVGFSSYTPTQATQLSGFTPQNTKRGSKEGGRYTLDRGIKRN